MFFLWQRAFARNVEFLWDQSRQLPTFKFFTQFNTVYALFYFYILYKRSLVLSQLRNHDILTTPSLSIVALICSDPGVTVNSDLNIRKTTNKCFRQSIISAREILTSIYSPVDMTSQLVGQPSGNPKRQVRIPLKSTQFFEVTFAWNVLH